MGWGSDFLKAISYAAPVLSAAGGMYAGYGGGAEGAGVDIGGDTSGYGDVGYTAGDAAGEAGGMGVDPFGGFGGASYLTPEQDLFDEMMRASAGEGASPYGGSLSATAAGSGPATAGATGGIGSVAAEGAGEVGKDAARQPAWQKLLMAGLMGGGQVGLNALQQSQQPKAPKFPMPNRPGMAPQAAPYVDPVGTKASPTLMQSPGAVKISQGLSRRKNATGGFAV